MDIYEYLKMDHKKVAKLFDLYATATTQVNKEEIFQMIKQELLVHADAEAATFYKKLAETDAKDAIHGEEEHNEIKFKLKEISALKSVDKKMDRKMEELKKLVEHHVSEEEGSFFRAARSVLTDEEAWIIKEKMHDLKGKMLLKMETEAESGAEVEYQ